LSEVTFNYNPSLKTGIIINNNDGTDAIQKGEKVGCFFTFNRGIILPNVYRNLIL